MALEAIPPKAVILAAGRGERLRPPTDGLPNPMLPIGGRPLLEHLLALLVEAGVREVAINLHHEPEAVRSYLGDGSRPGLRVVYSHEETLLGTAGALRRLTPPESRLVAAMERRRSIGVEEIPEEDGKIVFGRFFALPSGREKALRIERVSPTIVDAEPGYWEHRLFVQKQPGQQVLPTTVRVVPPAGMKIRSVVVGGDAYAADSDIALVLEPDWTLQPEPGAA